MFWLERRALKEGLVNVELARTGVDDTTASAPAPSPYKETSTVWQKTVQTFQECDTIGLLLLGFGWALVRGLC